MFIFKNANKTANGVGRSGEEFSKKKKKCMPSYQVDLNILSVPN